MTVYSYVARPEEGSCGVVFLSAILAALFFSLENKKFIKTIYNLKVLCYNVAVRTVCIIGLRVGLSMYCPDS